MQVARGRKPASLTSSTKRPIDELALVLLNAVRKSHSPTGMSTTALRGLLASNDIEAFAKLVEKRRNNVPLKTARALIDQWLP